MHSLAAPRDASGRTFAQYVADQIADALYRDGRSINQAADAIGMNHMTLRRSLDGGRVFNLNDVADIAHALGVDPADLMNAEGFEPV